MRSQLASSADSSKPTRIARQAFAHLFFEKATEEVALKYRRVGRGRANDDSHDVVGKQRLAAGTLDLLLHLVQNGDANLGHFRRIAHGL
jgi:hypothetical protein